MAAALALLLQRDPKGVSPPPDAAPFAETVEAVVAREAPYDGHGAEDFGALILLTGYEEGHFTLTAEGDHGEAHCMLQIHEPWSMVGTLEGCVKRGIANMRESLRMARATGHPEAPLAQYMGTCRNEKVREMAKRRMARALGLAKAARAQVALEAKAVKAAGAMPVGALAVE